MRLKWVELDRFRNLEQQKVQLHPRYNLLLGRNGQGKTNFLEAIGYLGTLRSFRTAGRGEMIKRQESMCRVSGSVVSEGGEKVLALALTRAGRTQFLDDKKITSPEEFLQALKIVHFIPEDVGLIAGSPAWRRKVLDRAVFEITPHYASEYRKYLMTLRQRNALLRKGIASVPELKSWNSSLASNGAVLIQRRQDMINNLNPLLDELGRQLGLGEGLRLIYVASRQMTRPCGELQDHVGEDGICTQSQLPDRSYIERSLLQKLEELAEKENRSGHTLAGPHRDNIIFKFGKEERSTDLARYGSQGQKRSAVLAFKLALAINFQKQKGFWPLVLLDDVASELDVTRRKALGSIIRGTDAQFFISTTGEEYMFLPAEEGRIFQVTDGRLEPFSVSGRSRHLADN